MSACLWFSPQCVQWEMAALGECCQLLNTHLTHLAHLVPLFATIKELKDKLHLRRERCLASHLALALTGPTHRERSSFQSKGLVLLSFFLAFFSPFSPSPLLTNWPFHPSALGKCRRVHVYAFICQSYLLQKFQFSCAQLPLILLSVC